ncbi:MAG TPA: ChaN family lipoprotein [Bacteroidia bacterium]|nr:ChaN family lipoprotein [Bacteroidia bacterium]
MKKLLYFSLAGFISFSFIADKKAYSIFDTNGKISSYDDLLKAAESSDVVLFGEEHDNPIIHWLELELTKDLYAAKKDKLVMGAEMFESDDQLIVDEYLAGKLSENTFKDEAKLWSNYATDYKPLIEFAKENHVPFIATNIPRRYANLVYKRGLKSLDSLAPDAKKFIAPLPIKYDSTVRAYKEIFENAGGHGGQNLPMSQAVKDATMSYFLLKNFSAGKTFIHYEGAYHSNNHSGMAWYLSQSNPKLKVLVISSNTQASVDALEDGNTGSGDYIISVIESMTRTME